MQNTLKNLNGKIHLIIGNHDTDKKVEIYSNTSNIFDIQYATMIKYNKRLFYLSHFPTFTSTLTTNLDHAIINLFGHTHQTTTHFEDRKYMYHVGVDSNYGFPISLDEIHEYYKGGK